MAKRKKLFGIPYWHRGEYGWYADFRKYKDVGGGRCKVGDTEEEAHETISEKRAEYVSLRERRDSLDGGNPKVVDLARDHLRKKGATVKRKTLEGADRSIRHLIDFMGQDALVSDVTPRLLSDFIEWRLRQDGYRGDNIKPSTVNVDLAHISSMCKTAVAYGVLDSNPVSKVPNRPTVRPAERVWLERGEAWRVMECAFDLRNDPDSRCYPYLPELISTFLLTGGRSQEVRGLQVCDVDFTNEAVHFRPNRVRDLKRARHSRVIRLWPQLLGILKPHIDELDGDLLFPSMTVSSSPIVGEFTESLDKVLEMANITKRVTPHTFRHTYTAHRLQTTEHGHPVSPYTVARELGHKGLAQIEDTYGHLLKTRNRSPVVSYGEATVTDIREAK